MTTQFHLTEAMRRQGYAEQAALNEFDKSLQGLSCAVDPDLVIRAQRPDWDSWNRVRVLWVSVDETQGGTRTAVGLVPEDLRGIHQRRHCVTADMFGRGWARRPLVAASLRCVIAALLDRSIPSDPFAAQSQKAELWARALALHYLGLRELTSDAVTRFVGKNGYDTAKAGVRAAGLSQDIRPLLDAIDYLYDGNGTGTLGEKLDEIFLLSRTIAISFACGALEGRSPASESQIHRLKRQLPSEFDLALVSSLPKIHRSSPMVARS